MSSSDLETYIGGLFNDTAYHNIYRVGGGRYVHELRLAKLGHRFDVDVCHFWGGSGSVYQLCDESRHRVHELLADLAAFNDHAWADHVDDQRERYAVMAGVG